MFASFWHSKTPSYRILRKPTCQMAVSAGNTRIGGMIVPRVRFAFSRSAQRVNRVKMKTAAQIFGIVNPHQRGIVPDTVKKYARRRFPSSAFDHMRRAIAARNIAFRNLAAPLRQQTVIGIPYDLSALFASVNIHRVLPPHLQIKLNENRFGEGTPADHSVFGDSGFAGNVFVQAASGITGPDKHSQAKAGEFAPYAVN